jgi:MFS family permease
MNPGESGMANASQQTAGSVFSKQQVFMAISAIFVGYFVNAYFMQSMGNAAPKIASALNAVSLIGWSVSIPSLGLAIATLLGGKLSDIYGRRALLMAAMIFVLLGTILSAISATFVAFIVGRTILSLGLGIVSPLCYTVIGDIFARAADRGKWIGLLNIPMGLPTFFAPTLSGWLIENKGWQQIFWWALPVTVLCILVAYRMPPLIQSAARKIDIPGAILATLTSTAMIFGFSFAGITYPWGSWQVISLLGLAVIFGALFLLAESKAEEPFLHLDLFKNRTFMTASIAGFLSFFGMMSITLYFPLLMQGIQARTATESGQIITPFGVLMTFIGVPTGFLLARTKKYKVLFIAGYCLVAAVMIGMIFFDQTTSKFWGVTAATLAGLGLGVIPTINTLLIQAAVPRKLMGSAMAVLFFSISIGMATASAIQNSAMNVQYGKTLNTCLPEAIKSATSKETHNLINDSGVLLSKDKMSELQRAVDKIDNAKPDLLENTVSAIRKSAEDGLKVVFLIAAITMVLAFLLILTIPVIPMDRPAEE